MYWEKCNIHYFSSGPNEFVKISGYNIINSKPHWIYIARDAFEKLQNGIPLSIAIKEYDLDVKEFLISGLVPTTNSIFVFERESIQKAFVTNAVANSVVFYAMAYLNNKGLTPLEIKNLRLKYSLGNLDKRYFSKDELKNSFICQSAFFLNLYKEMNENDRFENFAENLEQQKRFKDIFKFYNDFIALQKQYHRRIFHDKLECESMRSDYKEETWHKNSGIFSEDQMIKNQHYYIVDKVYLKELGMRLCKICGKE